MDGGSLAGYESANVLSIIFSRIAAISPDATLPLTKIKSRLPFTDEEWEKILWATEVYPPQSKYLRTRLRVFILLLRYSGLRIRDAVQLRYDGSPRGNC